MTFNDPGVDTNDAKTQVNQRKPEAKQNLPPCEAMMITKIN